MSRNQESQMKNKLLYAVAAIMMLFSTTKAVAAASNPYAVYCDGNKTLYFVHAQSKPDKNTPFRDEQYPTTVTSLNSDYFEGCVGAENATKVIIEESFNKFMPVTCLNWFYGLSKVTEIEGLGYINTSSVKTMSQMFRDCSSLTSLDLSSFKTSNVTNMSGMFRGCSALTSLDLSYFETDKVNSMRDMFNGCSSLTSLNFCNIYTNNTLDVGDMFTDCNNLRLVDLSKSKYTQANFRNITAQIPGNPLIFIPDNIDVVKTVNIVVNGVCENLVIGDTDENYHQLLLSVPYAFTANNITIKRKFNNNIPYTLFMPFAINATAYGTFWTGGKLSDDGSTVNFSKHEDGVTVANQPYLFVPHKDYLEGITIEVPVSVNKTTPGNENDGFNGVYEKKVFSADEIEQNRYYGWAGGEFLLASEGATVDAGRAYFKLPESNASNAPASLKVKLNENITTGISDINSDATATDTPVYNLNGQRVTDSYKGIVVKNGVKILSR